MKKDWSKLRELIIILCVLVFIVVTLTTPIFIYLLH